MSGNNSEKLNDLCQGESAVAETYKQAISKLGTDPRATDLTEIQSNHFDAVLSLKTQIKVRGVESSGGLTCAEKPLML